MEDCPSHPEPLQGHNRTRRCDQKACPPEAWGHRPCHPQDVPEASDSDRLLSPQASNPLVGTAEGPREEGVTHITASSS